MVTAINKRKERDLMKLMMSSYEVTMNENNNSNDFFVNIKGPYDSNYEGVNLTNKNLLQLLIFREFGVYM